MERWGSGEVNQAVAAVLLTGSIRAEKGDEAAAPTQILCTLLEQEAQLARDEWRGGDRKRER